MLKLKLQYFGHLMRRADSLEKTLMLGGIGGRRKRGRQRMRWLVGITDSMEMRGGKERYTHLNAEFQGIARRDKKAFLSDQYLLNGKDPDAGRDWG